jgi:hypothetical protein
MAVQRHSPAATGATDRAYPEPACMWLQGYIFRVAIPSQSKRALCHRRTGEHFSEHEHQRKMFGCSANEYEHHPLGCSFFATMFTQE